MTKENCLGCRDNFYNHTTVKGCWNFPNAKLIPQKKVGVDVPPPHTGEPKLFPNCYHADDFFYVKL